MLKINSESKLNGCNYNYSEEYAIAVQKEVCLKYESEFLSSPFNFIVGVALKTFNTSNPTINGLRHPIEKNRTNWFIWAGEYSSAEDFFEPLHVSHLMEFCPKAIQYLGLSPGWRFLFDDNYEDVWYDEKLLITD